MWLEEEIAHYEIKKEEIAHYEMKIGRSPNLLSKEDETRYMLSQELLHWILGSKFDTRYSASPVSRVPCSVEEAQNETRR